MLVKVMRRVYGSMYRENVILMGAEGLYPPRFLHADNLLECTGALWTLKPLSYPTHRNLQYCREEKTLGPFNSDWLLFDITMAFSWGFQLLFLIK
ncbi:hypothetical protein LIER_17469 [Lithospermum erythrorhizon]|uniref:Uncharacterized protein n=1 Tax=Lithospermum erythrorhizon TaxID=34254 RepID=A0AAV3QCS6_LITER